MAETSPMDEIALDEFRPDTVRRVVASLETELAAAKERSEAIRRDEMIRCSTVVSTEPLGYRTEAEHEVLESFADRVIARMARPFTDAAITEPTHPQPADTKAKP